MKKESLLLVIGILFGIGFFIVCDGLLTSYEVSKLPPAFKLFGKQGVEMFSTSCTPRILHVYFDGDANSLLFKGQYDEFVAQTNESAEASEFEAKMRQDQLVFAPTCKGSTLVFFYSPQENAIKEVLVKKKGWFEYIYIKPSSLPDE